MLLLIGRHLNTWYSTYQLVPTHSNPDTLIWVSRPSFFIYLLTTHFSLSLSLSLSLPLPLSHIIVERIGNGNRYIEVAKKEECIDTAHLERFFQDVMEQGGEGVILRDPFACLVAGRTTLASASLYFYIQ